MSTNVHLVLQAWNHSSLETIMKQAKGTLPCRSSDTPLQPLPTQTQLKESIRQLQPAFRISRGLKQTHLDLGQV